MGFGSRPISGTHFAYASRVRHFTRSASAEVALRRTSGTMDPPKPASIALPKHTNGLNCDHRYVDKYHIQNTMSLLGPVRTWGMSDMSPLCAPKRTSPAAPRAHALGCGFRN